MRRFIVLAAALAVAAPAFAQTRLPRVNPTEQQVQDINRSLQRQQRNLNEQQQSQFEINQMRQELNRRETVPSMTGPGSIGRICAPGQIGC